MVDVAPRLTIAVLHRTFRGEAGGAEAYAVAIASALAQSHDVHVFAQEWDASLQGLTYHPIPLYFKRPRWLNQLWFALASWWLTRHGFDIVHSHENTWHGQVQTIHVVPMRCKSLAHLSLGRRWSKKLLFVLSPRLWTYTALEFFRFYLCSMRYWVAVSKPLQQQLLSMNPPLPASRLLCIAPGIDDRTLNLRIMDKMARKPQPGIPKTLLWVGNDAVKKNLDTVLSVLAQLDDTYMLHIVGKASPHQPWQDKVTRLGLTHRVRYSGVVSDMTETYLAADMLLHPTLEDTFGMVVLEAMSWACPVVVSQAGYCGIAAELNDGVNATLLSDPLDIKALFAAVTSLFVPEIYAQQQEAALAFSQQHLWSDAAKQYADLYKELAPK